MSKILIATEKPFSKQAVAEVKQIFETSGDEVRLLEKYSDKSELIEAVSDVDALIIRSDKITREVMDAAPELKIVVRAGAGYDNVDLEAATEKGVVVMNTPGQNSNAVAELAFGMMIYLNRNSFNGSSGTELRQKKIGIHAYGYVGRIVAMIAKGMGMKVFAHDPYIEKAIIENDGVTWIENVEDLYKKCQYISLHIPANAETKGSINEQLLSVMPKGATLVNTARKEVIDEAALVKVMGDRDDLRYISDIAPDCKEVIESTFEGRYFFTPKKSGAQTAEANLNAGVAAANQIVGYLQKGDTTYKVN